MPGDTDLASPGKQLFAMILIIRWLQIKGLPGDLHEQAPEALRGQFGRKTAVWSRKGTKKGTPNQLKTANREENGSSSNFVLSS